MRTLSTSILALSALGFSGLAACAAPDQPETKDTMTSEVETASDAAAEYNDPNLWLEEVEGENALAWVRSQNERSLDDLTSDPRFDRLHERALDIVNAKERIPYGTVRAGQVYNFWQDETNVRGIWRRTSLESYGTDSPEWETVLDFDKLAEDEGKNWVFKGSSCFAPIGSDEYTCLVTLSDGGKDAAIRREFDLQTKTFVEGGFEMPEAKAGTSWLDKDTLLVSTDWGEDGATLTESGYPSIVKKWKRGTPLADAETYFSSEKTDIAAWPWAIELEDGTRLTGAVGSDTFFTASYWWFPEEGEPVKWPIPPRVEIEGLYKGKLLMTLEQDWQPEGQNAYKSGDLVAFDFAEFLETKDLPKLELVFRPNAKQAVNGVSIAKGAALLSISDNVRGQILRIDPNSGKDLWKAEALPLPENGQVRITFSDKDQETVFINYEGFLTPDTLYSFNVTTNDIEPVKSLPAKFDASNYQVQQFEATSSDGTKIPYFVVHSKDIPMDGSTPTLQYGYGGFQIPMRPSYSASVGRMWLDEGGAYILANIRGGSEFGPEWHKAGLKTKRQLIFDDFQAVSEDAIARGITSSEKLGIMGGSNGGLLMGVSMTQRPELYNAVVIQVPLLDMLRYHLLLAGASWVDEYGSPEVPEERAFLEKTSPYQNFDAEADYPTPLFVTSTKDDRVHPGHARKMAKLFEDADKPFLYYENIDGGHSAAANLQEAAKRRALEYTYLAQRLMGEAESGED